ncbi:MAG: vitamin K epoxide reductase family protein [Jatrophihabitans sp.]
MLAAVAGLGVSTYLTIEHYTHSGTLACPESAAISCVKVTTSKWAVIAGVPVALLGLLYFAAMTMLVALPSERRDMKLIRATAATAGVAMVLYLLYIELFEVNALCLWCTAVHALTIVLFGAVLWDALTTDTPTRAPS